MEYIKELCQSEDIEELQSVFSKAINAVGISSFGYILKESQPNQVPFHVTTYTPKWVDHYFASGYQEIDPVIKVMDTSESPFIWSDTWRGLIQTQKQKAFFNEAKEYNLAYGMGVPIFSNGMGDAHISFVSSEDEKNTKAIFKEDIYKLALYATHFHYNALALSNRIKRVPQSNNVYELTPREIDIIKWSFESKTYPEIAIILGISINTVSFHVKNIYLKMGAQSRQEMIVKALIDGIVIV